MMPGGRLLTHAAACAAAASLVAIAGARASDGVLEINQTCAVQTGCFAGDTAGFPVTITQPGSYVLTGNLSGFTAEAVRITADGVTVDLGGFAIRGPGTCSGTPPSCSGAGSTVGVGSETQLGIPIRHGLGVRNGHISGVATGVLVGNDSSVEDLTLRSLSNRAIVATNGCRIARNTIWNVGGDFGIAAAGVGCLISDNAIYNTADVAISIGPDAGYADNVVSDSVGGVTGSGRGLAANLCDGHLCGPSVPIQRRYYLTQTGFDGAQAASACAASFHLASFWEIRDTSSLRYDTDLGYASGDSGEGPADAWGWVQSGDGTCYGYTTAAPSVLGKVVKIFREGPVGTFYQHWDSRDWNTSSSEPIELIYTWGWRAEGVSCDNSRRVWCVQDD